MCYHVCVITTDMNYSSFPCPEGQLLNFINVKLYIVGYCYTQAVKVLGFDRHERKSYQSCPYRVYFTFQHWNNTVNSSSGFFHFSVIHTRILVTNAQIPPSKYGSISERTGYTDLKT